MIVAITIMVRAKRVKMVSIFFVLSALVKMAAAYFGIFSYRLINLNHVFILFTSEISP